MYAAYYGRLPVVILLLKHNAQVDLQDKVRSDLIRSLASLINAPLPLNRHDAQGGRTALMLAQEKNRDSIVDLLNRHNSKVTLDTSWSKDAINAFSLETSCISNTLFIQMATKSETSLDAIKQAASSDVPGQP